MRTQVPDGQPKALLVLLPGYPLLNFAAVSAREWTASGRRRHAHAHTHECMNAASAGDVLCASLFRCRHALP